MDAHDGAASRREGGWLLDATGRYHVVAELREHNKAESERTYRQEAAGRPEARCKRQRAGQGRLRLCRAVLLRVRLLLQQRNATQRNHSTTQSLNHSITRSLGWRGRSWLSLRFLRGLRSPLARGRQRMWMQHCSLLLPPRRPRKLVSSRREQKQKLKNSAARRGRQSRNGCSKSPPSTNHIPSRASLDQGRMSRPCPALTGQDEVHLVWDSTKVPEDTCAGRAGVLEDGRTAGEGEGLGGGGDALLSSPPPSLGKLRNV